MSSVSVNCDGENLLNFTDGDYSWVLVLQFDFTRFTRDMFYCGFCLKLYCTINVINAEQSATIIKYTVTLTVIWLCSASTSTSTFTLILLQKSDLVVPVLFFVAAAVASFPLMLYNLQNKTTWRWFSSEGDKSCLLVIVQCECVWVCVFKWQRKEWRRNTVVSAASSCLSSPPHREQGCAAGNRLISCISSAPMKPNHTCLTISSFIHTPFRYSKDIISCFLCCSLKFFFFTKCCIGWCGNP